jgi:hypothetical protein
VIGEEAAWNRVLSLSEMTACWEAARKRYVQPFNLLMNAYATPEGFEDTVARWTLTGAGATWAQEAGAGNFYTGSKSGALTRAGANCYAGQLPTFNNSYKGQAFTFAAMCKGSVAARSNIRLNDGVSDSDSSYHTGGGAFERLVLTKTLAAAASQLDSRLRVVTGDTTTYFDEAWLVRGDHV